MGIAETKTVVVTLGWGDIGVLTSQTRKNELLLVELYEPEEVGSCRMVNDDDSNCDLDKPVVIMRFDNRDSLDVVIGELARMRFEWDD